MIEVHLSVTTGPENEGLAVLADIVDYDLTVHLDDSLAVALTRNPVNVVLLVAGVVQVEEHVVSVGSPVDGPPSVSGDLTLAPLSHVFALDVEHVQLVAAGDVVIECDLAAVWRYRRMCQRRQ
jgi:hypothetical protein